MSKGVNNYPTYQKYFKRGDSFHDKEIMVTTKEFLNSTDIIGVYHLAVYGNETS